MRKPLIYKGFLVFTVKLKILFQFSMEKAKKQEKSIDRQNFTML